MSLLKITQKYRAKSLFVFVMSIGVLSIYLSSIKTTDFYLSFPEPSSLSSPIPSTEEFLDIQKKADDNNSICQLYMGIFYANGSGVKQNYARAAEWYEKAANNGNPTAQFYLGWLFECGIGVRQNYTKAFEWYNQAVKQNDAAAHLAIAGYHLAYRKDDLPLFWGSYNEWRLKAFYILQMRYHYPIYEDTFWQAYNGHLEYYQNDYLLAQNINKQAILGNADSALCMVNIYIHARGIKQNRKSAYAWLLKAAKLGNHNAQYILGWTDKKTNMFNILIDENQRKKYQVEASASSKYKYFKFKRLQQLLKNNQNNTVIFKEMLSLAREEYAQAQLEIGWYYFNNRMYRDAYYWAERATKNGYIAANTLLATVYIYDKSMNLDFKSFETSIKPLLVFPDQGIFLGWIRAVKQLSKKSNYKLAFDLYLLELNAEATNKNILAMIILSHFTNIGDERLIRLYFETQHEFPEYSYYKLGCIYDIIGDDEPEGRNENANLAREWLLKAHELKFLPASAKLLDKSAKFIKENEEIFYIKIFDEFINNIDWMKYNNRDIRHNTERLIRDRMFWHLVRQPLGQVKSGVSSEFSAFDQNMNIKYAEL